MILDALQQHLRREVSDRPGKLPKLQLGLLLFRDGKAKISNDDVAMRRGARAEKILELNVTMEHGKSLAMREGIEELANPFGYEWDGYGWYACIRILCRCVAFHASMYIVGTARSHNVVTLDAFASRLPALEALEEWEHK